MFSFFKRSSKKDATNDRSATTSDKRQNSANENKNKPVRTLNSSSTNLPGDVIKENSQESIKETMSPMAALRNKNKKRKQNQKNQKLTNKTALVNENSVKSGNSNVASSEPTCSNLNQSANFVHGAMKLKIDIPGVINSSKNIKSGGNITQKQTSTSFKNDIKETTTQKENLNEKTTKKGNKNFTKTQNVNSKPTEVKMGNTQEGQLTEEVSTRFLNETNAIKAEKLNIEEGSIVLPSTEYSGHGKVSKEIQQKEDISLIASKKKHDSKEEPILAASECPELVKISEIKHSEPVQQKEELSSASQKPHSMQSENNNSKEESIALAASGCSTTHSEPVQQKEEISSQKHCPTQLEQKNDKNDKLEMHPSKVIQDNKLEELTTHISKDDVSEKSQTKNGSMEKVTQVLNQSKLDDKNERVEEMNDIKKTEQSQSTNEINDEIVKNVDTKTIEKQIDNLVNEKGEENMVVDTCETSCKTEPRLNADQKDNGYQIDNKESLEVTNIKLEENILLCQTDLNNVQVQPNITKTLENEIESDDIHENLTERTLDSNVQDLNSTCENKIERDINTNAIKIIVSGPSVEEWVKEVNCEVENLIKDVNVEDSVNQQGTLDEERMRNLVNQEANFQAQLAELNQQLATREEDTNKLRYQIDDMQRDLYIKSSGMDRLQAELLAAHKDGESIKLNLRHLQADILTFKQKNSELGEELAKKSEEYKALEELSNEKVSKLESTIQELTENMNALQTQLNNLKEEKDKIETHKKQLEEEREEEKKIVQDALDAAIEEKQNIQKRWEHDFEQLRNVNTDREQQMFNDFEWKLREVEQSCKRRLEEKDRKTEEKLKERQKELDAKIKKAEQQITEVEHLKSIEAEVTQLRGLTNDQQRSLKIMARHTEEIEKRETSLRDEIAQLQTQIEKEKANLIMANHRHEKEISDKERQLLIRLEKQRGEVAVQWEQKLRQECARLKQELDQMHNEERHLAVELVKVQKDQEYLNTKKQWEDQLQKCLSEISDLKNTIEHKDEKHRLEIERLQTNTDQDVMQLRRELDKTDMSYHERIEKLAEGHEQEIERLNEEAEKRLRELETNYQMQISSMRTTLELVKEQMERESEDKIQHLREEHRIELDKQWDKLMEEKDNAINTLEQEYRAKYEKLKEQFQNIQKNHGNKEKELGKKLDNLKNDINDKESTISSLKNNVDTLNGGIQVLNHEIATHDQKMTKVKQESDQKISELQHQLKTERDHFQMEREEHMEEIAHLQKQSQNMIEQLQRKCQCLTKLFEEMRSRYDKRESRSEDVNLISDLRNVIAEQERDLAILNEEKRYYQMELMRIQADNQDLGNSNEDFLSVGGSNQSLPESSSEERYKSGKIEVIRSKSLGYVSKNQNRSLHSSLPD